MASPRPFQIDPVLTAIVVGYRNPAISLIADQVLPRIATAAKFGWTKYADGDAFSVPDGRVGRRGRVTRVEFSATEMTDAVDDYGWEGSVPQTDIDDAATQRANGLSVYDPMARTTSGLADIKLLAREQRVAAKVFAAASYDAARRIVLAGTSQFSDFVNSDPIGVINVGMDATMVRPNTMVFSQSGWTSFRSHPRIVKAVKGGISGDGMVTREQVRDLFEVQNVLVGAAQFNTAKKGQPVALSRVWGKHVALLHLNPMGGAGTDQPTFGFTAACGDGVAMVRDDSEVGLLGGTTVRVGERVKELISASPCGYFIQNAFA